MADYKTSNRKLKFAMAVFVLLILLAGGFFFTGIKDGVIWAAWFTALTMVYSSYVYGNVQTKKAIWIPMQKDEGAEPVEGFGNGQSG